MYVVMLDTDYMNKPTFKENFMNDWRKILGKNHVIQKLEDYDFTPIYEWHQREKEKKKQMIYKSLTKQYSLTFTLFLFPKVTINQFLYDGKGTLEEGETAKARFIKIQAAYELLMNVEKRRQYDIDNRVNPMKASQAWMEWLMKKRKAFDQRGDMVVAAWAAQQQREMNLRVRHLSLFIFLKLKKKCSIFYFCFRKTKVGCFKKIFLKTILSNNFQMFILNMVS
ncbi:hypothetical protein CsSME_00027235 [Camellia sinensis var. sinensis]